MADYIHIIDNKFASIKDIIKQNNLFSDNQENKKNRPSLVKMNKIVKNYGIVNQTVIDPYSSGEESDMEDEKMNEATMKDFYNTIFDYNTIMILKSSEFPSEARYGLLFSNIDDWMNKDFFKLFLREIPILIKEKIIPSIQEIRSIKLKTKLLYFVIFSELSHCEKIYSFFNQPYKKKHFPTKNNQGESIEVYYAYDLLDLTCSYWYSIILRNVPSTCTVDNIKSFCNTSSIQYVLGPIMIKNSYCAMVVLNDLDEAEKLCKSLNKKEIGKNRRIKVHLHPRCCKIRKNPEKSHFAQFFKGRNSQNPNILGTSLVKLFEKTIAEKVENVVKKVEDKKIKEEKKELITINPITDKKENNMNTSLLSAFFSQPLEDKDNKDKKEQAKSSELIYSIKNILDNMKNSHMNQPQISSNDNITINNEIKIKSEDESTPIILKNEEIPEISPKEIDLYKYDIKDKLYYEKPKEKPRIEEKRKGSFPYKSYDKSYKKPFHKNYTKNQTIINNVNINMIQNNDFNINTQGYNNNISINKIVKYDVLPPQEDRLPPLPKEMEEKFDERKIVELLEKTNVKIEMNMNLNHERFEPGQILSDEERRRRRKDTSQRKFIKKRRDSRSRSHKKKKNRIRSRSRSKNKQKKEKRKSSSSYSPFSVDHNEDGIYFRSLAERKGNKFYDNNDDQLYKKYSKEKERRDRTSKYK